MPPIAISPRIEERVARLTASTLWVTRTAPSGSPRASTGRAVARISSSSVCEWRCSWNVSPRSAAAISGRVE
jgi:hypothetical protein